MKPGRRLPAGIPALLRQQKGRYFPFRSMYLRDPMLRLPFSDKLGSRVLAASEVFSSVSICELIKINYKFYWMPTWYDLLLCSRYTRGKTWVWEKEKRGFWVRELAPSLRTYWGHPHTRWQFYPTNASDNCRDEILAVPFVSTPVW